VQPLLQGNDNKYYIFEVCVCRFMSGFGGLVVSMLASGTRVHGFKPGRSLRIFFGRKNPQHAFLRKGSKAVGPVLQICGTLKNPCDYVEVGSKAKFVGHFSSELSSFANRGLHARAAWTLLELTEETKMCGAQRASVIKV
jgi:hypothetical protein